jgi:7-carboxy-7-deazaguanine synthase
MRTTRGYISEVFGSFQGEGPHVGERHVFVRLCSCGLGCAYCDTGYARVRQPYARIEQGPGGKDVKLPNPLSVDEVARAVLAQEAHPGFNRALCITGGEPLEQPRFVRALLEALGGRFKVILETNGTLTGAFRTVGPFIDTVSMDIKLPSATGLAPMWRKHGSFMDACRGKELVVKVVVAGGTPVQEVARAAKLVGRKAGDAVFVIQPMSLKGGQKISGHRLLEYYAEAAIYLKYVRVIPQMHRYMGVR